MNAYFDYAATTPMDPAVLEAMLPYLKDNFANPSSIYRTARTTRKALEDARHTVANIFGAKPTEIVFTSGGTEGNNLAIQGAVFPRRGTNWITTAIEHDAVLAQIPLLRRDGHNCTVVPVTPSGIVDSQAIIDAIDDQTVLVSVMLANNEIGTIQPIADIAKQIAAIKADRQSRGIELPLYLHTDAIQAANYLDLHVDRLGVDLLTLSGSKLYGPKGTGVLYVRHGTDIEPLMYGGGQERGRRSGTENVAGAVGFAVALLSVQSQRDTESRRLAKLRDGVEKGIMAAIPDAILNGDKRRRLPNNLNLTIPGAEGEALVLYLDKTGILASTGSACSSGSLDPSHVLLALGRTKAEASQSLRLTLGQGTTAAMCDRLISELPTIVRRVREINAA
jgi:cysteine desulfurase